MTWKHLLSGFFWSFVYLLLLAALGVLIHLYWRDYHAPVGTTLLTRAAADLKHGPYEWPQFRGPDRNGTSPETGWGSRWEGRPRDLWRRDLGPGASGIAVSRGRLFTASHRADRDIVWCLDATSGEEYWRFEYECPLEKRQFEGGPASTPTVDGDSLYILSHEGQLFCLDAVRGRLVWAIHVVTDLGGSRPYWGYSGSVLVAANRVIVDIGGGGSTLALDGKTGKVIWKSGDDKAGYSSPVLFRTRGRDAVAVLKGQALVAHALDSGEVLWRYPWETSYNVNAAMPVVAGERIFISSGYDHGCALLDVGSGAPRVAWESTVLRTHFGSCLLHQGSIFGIDDGGELRCVDIEKGDVKWKHGGFGKGTVILAGGTLIILSERGELATAEASSEGYRELARCKVLSRRCWVSPALANGLLYVRDNEGMVACLDLRV